MNRQEATRTIEALEAALAALHEVVVAEDGGETIDPDNDISGAYQAADGSWTAYWVEASVVYRRKEQPGFSGPRIAARHGDEKWHEAEEAARRELRCEYSA